jgi:hypothetical protein
MGEPEDAGETVKPAAQSKRRQSTFHPSVIPGRAKREPGIHNHDREHGFRACAKWRIPE